MPQSADSSLQILGSRMQWAGLIAGPLAALVAHALIPASPELSESGRRTIALAVLMAVWWMTEAIPLSATALLPICLLPLLKVVSLKHAAAPYADEIIYLFMGGFLLGGAMQKWGLHRRIALRALLIVGTRPTLMIGGIMLATAVISMWVSNTATTIMMLPIALSIIALVESDRKTNGGSWSAADISNFSVALLLGIAYAASIGGVATPIGTPPNLVMIGYVRKTLGIDISFAQWMAIGLPLTAVFLPASWFLLTRILHPVRAGRIHGGREFLRSELVSLGPMNRGEWATMIIFVFAVVGWVFRAPLAEGLGLVSVVTEGGKEVQVVWLKEAGVAMIAAVALFFIPVSFRPRRFVLTWEDAEKLPWGILLLFGGGLSMSAAIETTGVDDYMGMLFGSLSGIHLFVLLLILIACVVLAGELAGNTALAATLMPILGAAAAGLGLDPLLLLFAAALGASCGFMLPVATPPNAIVFASGRIGMPRMIRAGALMDILSIILITALMYLAGAWLIRLSGIGT